MFDTLGNTSLANLYSATAIKLKTMPKHSDSQIQDIRDEICKTVISYLFAIELLEENIANTVTRTIYISDRFHGSNLLIHEARFSYLVSAIREHFIFWVSQFPDLFEDDIQNQFYTWEQIHEDMVLADLDL